jgi:adenine-specific DNA-methyltransferase
LTHTGGKSVNDFFEELINVLRSEERYFSREGKELLRNTVYEDAMKMEPSLIRILLSSDDMKRRFFTDIDGTLVFDKVGFGWVISNRELLPDSFTRYKNKIGLADSRGNLFSVSGDVELVFPYKDCILGGGQTNDGQKRQEIFHNETLAPDEVDRLLCPKALCKPVRYSASGEEAVGTLNDNDNLIIKGNNLLVVSSLLKRYEGRVKCIYIDPPYYFKERKEADTFKYNTNFSLSTWLVFMKDRLIAAKKLLTLGGTIWISISEDGMHYLKVMADDIFGSDHFVGTIPRRTRNGKSDVPFNFSQDFDWLLCYTNVDDKHAPVGRSVERKYYSTPDYPNDPWRLADLTKQTTAGERVNSFFTMVDPKTGNKYPASERRTWCITEDTFDYYYRKGAIIFPGEYDFLNISKPYMRKFKSEDDASGKLSAVISDFQLQEFLAAVLSRAKNKDGNDEIDTLFRREEFDYAKPENLIKAILDVATVAGDIVLDYHLGSGTTAAVAHKMGRQYIGVEQMDYIQTLPVERLKKVIAGENGGISGAVNWKGGGSFVYCELAEQNITFINRIRDAKSDDDLFRIMDEIIKTGYISYKVSPSDIAANSADFAELSTEDKKRLLVELLDKNLLYVNYCDMNDAEFSLTIEDKAFTRSFYREA